MDRLELYGKLSFLKGGIVYADRVTMVSQRYAEEIQTQEFGCGLDGVLRARKADLSGIVNGIDETEWDPETDPDIPTSYSLATLEKKDQNKKLLQQENRLDPEADIPLFGIVSRLADQKGLDILAPAMESLAKEEARIQFVVLGTGQEKYHKIFKDLAKSYPKKFGMNIRFDAKLAKRIYAGSDFFLMPSQYEPCGLGQLIAMRYGTVPVVRETGGLADTVREFHPRTGEGNGIVFRNYTAKALLDAIKRAVSLFKDKKSWPVIQKNGMTSDFSWTFSAKKYTELYKQAERKAVNT
jgi:starch synthase